MTHADPHSPLYYSFIRSRSIPGVQSRCISAFAEALEVIPYTLAENAGLNPIGIVTDLRSKHVSGFSNYGLNVKKVGRKTWL